MKNLISKIKELFCHHKYKHLGSKNLFSRDGKHFYHIDAFKCKYCGKFKKTQTEIDWR